MILESNNRVARRKEVKHQFEQFVQERRSLLAIHYACEGLDPDEFQRSPRISAIVVCHIGSGQLHSFSIDMFAELNGVDARVPDENYCEIEKKLLDAFYAFVEQNQDFNWVHWNMRDQTYGFQAIAHRYRVLKGVPIDIRESNIFDLGRFTAIYYGGRFAEHPRFYNLLEINGLKFPDLLTGQDESEAFCDKKFGKIHRSVLRKVMVLAMFVGKIQEGSLKINSSRRDLYGSYWEYAKQMLVHHWVIALITLLSAIITIIVSIKSQLT